MASPHTQHPGASHWQVQVRQKSTKLDGHGRAVLSDVRQIGLDHVEGIRSSRIYLLAGRLIEDDVQLLAKSLLCDPVAEVFDIAHGFSTRDDNHPAVEVHALPGVMNPVAMSAHEAIERLLSARGSSDAQIEAVQTARRYEIIGAGDVSELERIAAEVVANGCIETCYIEGFGRRDAIPDEFPTPPSKPFSLRSVAMRDMQDDALAKLSRSGHLFLSLAEMHTVRDHFVALKRDPTDLELETIAQTWSEHCVHKTLKSAFDYSGDDFGRPGRVEVGFDNLLKETIVAATVGLNRDWCLSVFVDNAGVIAFDDELGLAFKAETHNHPSAIEPYGGAATGIGGCIRDIMGCGLGAKPIASTNVFCLAPPDFDAARLPKDVLHPRRVLKGVVGGVRDYGNRMGIPTVNGALYFDERYLANPLVFCGCIGLIPRDKIDKAPQAGDFIVVAGGRTGRDGIHGATFSSAELTDTHADEFSHAVQIGHAIEEKKVLDALLLARDHPSGCLYSAVTDCGAGGLSSAIGEMGEHIGAAVDLEKVPLKYTGLRYDEIWISEAQERMVFSVAPDRLATMLEIFAAEEVEATAIGEFTGDHVLHVRFQGETVGKLDMSFLHDGFPRQRLKASWTAKPAAIALPGQHDKSETCDDPNARLLSSLGSLNTASKEWVIRQYDHEVQGRSVIKPLSGPKSGPSDAAVLRPRYDSDRGVAIGCGMCPELGDVDPYAMAVAAVDEAFRNVICVGANPERVAILDNFCWPKVDNEESLGALVRTCKGAYDVAMAFGLPFVSGKDSLNNEFTMSKEEATRTGLPDRIAIPYTLLVSAMGIVDDVRRCVSSDLKSPDHALVLASAPVIDFPKAANGEVLVVRTSFETALAMHQKVAELIGAGKVFSAHDVSDGGLSVALAEMCIASGLGATVDITTEAFAGCVFSSVTTTYLMEMKVDDAQSTGLPIIGQVTNEPRLRLARNGRPRIDLPIADAAQAWRAPLAAGGGL